MYYTLTQ